MSVPESKRKADQLSTMLAAGEPATKKGTLQFKKLSKEEFELKQRLEDAQYAVTKAAEKTSEGKEGLTRNATVKLVKQNYPSLFPETFHESRVRDWEKKGRRRNDASGPGKGWKKGKTVIPQSSWYSWAHSSWASMRPAGHGTIFKEMCIEFEISTKYILYVWFKL